MESRTGEQQIDVEGSATTVLLEPASDGQADVVVVLAHGAGGHMGHRTMDAYAAALRGCGADVVRFNFLYRAEGRGAPDPMPKLQACYRAVVDWVRAAQPQLAGRASAPLGRRLVIGGHSLGGRVASMLAADGLACDGLLLLAYPLHPPGKPQQLRDAHLARIRQPVLCFNGTRDAFCAKDLMDPVVAKLSPNWQQHWIEDADHGFNVPKRSGRAGEDVTCEIAAAVQNWTKSLNAGEHCS